MRERESERASERERERERESARARDRESSCYAVVVYYSSNKHTDALHHQLRRRATRGGPRRSGHIPTPRRRPWRARSKA